MAQRGKKEPKAKAKAASKRGRADASTRAAGLSDLEARAALKASDKLYYRIGEVSQLTGVKAHVLRYWETEFRWMAPPKSRSKQRLYRKRDIEFVWLLKRLLWEERYTIAGARQRIQELGVDDALALLDSPSASQPAPRTGSPAATGTESEKRADAATATSPSDGAGPTGAEWVSLSAALEAMQSELLSLRGALQEGL